MDGIDELKANAKGWRKQQHSRICRSSTIDRKVNETELRFSARMSQGRSAHYMGYRFWYLALRAFGNTLRDPAALGLLWGYIGAAVGGRHTSRTRRLATSADGSLYGALP